MCGKLGSAVVLAIALVSGVLAPDASAQGLAASGVLTGISDDSLRVRVGRAIAEIPLQEVEEVQKRRDPPWNGMLIGAALGAAIGFGTYTECDPVPPAKTCEGNLATSRGMETAAAAALFGALGLTADLLLDRSRTVSRTAHPRRGFTVAVSPTGVAAHYRIVF